MDAPISTLIKLIGLTAEGAHHIACEADHYGLDDRRDEQLDKAEESQTHAWLQPRSSVDHDELPDGVQHEYAAWLPVNLPLTHNRGLWPIFGRWYPEMVSTDIPQEGAA